MDLSYIESTLPAGFRFCPSDEELLCYYLQKKVTNERASQGTMVEVDLHTHEPWELPEAAKLNKNEWYFFSFRDRKYATGWRSNRATKSGYWKATGRDRTVCDPKSREVVVGMRKTLVFYEGRAPNGKKTNWVMHEFRLEPLHTPPKEDWVLCRVFHKKTGGGLVKYNSSENEQENTREMSCFSSVYMDLDLSPPHRDQQMPDSSRACHGHVTTSAFPLLPQQDLAWLHYDFQLESKGSGEDGGLLFDIGLDGEHGHELVGAGMEDDFGGASGGGVLVRGGNDDDDVQAFF